ncbi:MAG: DUF6464 family protein [Oculatellaceae cyanobacterium Prado106]|jgi:hypothetical protein|nr:DUF6464 family protein [Oculatellaceae cyanobacterium Prado106]
MEQETLPTEVILSHPQQTLGRLRLDWNPQPGAHLDVEGKTYTVLERRHRYQLKSGKYCLQTISLYVQSAQATAEHSYINGRSILGDATCRFNACSELIRCAVNPEGPCQGCRFYEKKGGNEV